MLGGGNVIFRVKTPLVALTYETGESFLTRRSLMLSDQTICELAFRCRPQVG